MVYILFAAVFYSSTATNFKHEFKKQVDCETALHNFKLNFTKVEGFCQQASK
jgi:hypothetical protein